MTFDWTWTLDIGHWVLDQSFIYLYIYYCFNNKKILTIKYLGIFEGQIWIHSVNIFDWTWTLDIRHWTLDIEHWTLDNGHWTLDIDWILGIVHWTMDIGHWILDIVEIQCRDTV